MDIETAVEKKAQLESELFETTSKKVKEFEEETGLVVSAVKMETMEITEIGQGKKCQLVRYVVVVKL